ncbi:MAG TPA: hypothetical protein VHK88_11205, partial [Aquihabitans sp.]|nr:hypothetical protein [Aquihabitans sp.]
MTPVGTEAAEAQLAPVPLRLPTPERARRRPGARVEPRRHHDGHLDLAAMERTIPRGRDAEDGDPTPAVDPSVWFL